MKRWIKGTLVLLIISLAGCGNVLNALGIQTLTITLFNATDFPVDGSLYTNKHEEFSVGDITLTGDERTFDLDPNESVSFSDLSCDDVQAMQITDANLRIALGISPSASTDTLFDGDDFHCGEKLMFTFTQQGLLDDFEIVLTRQ